MEKKEIIENQELFIKIHQLNEYSSRTINQYKQGISLFLQFIEEKENISKLDMLEYKKMLTDRYSSTKSINKNITIINKYLKWVSKEDKYDLDLKDIKCDLCLKKIKAQEKSSNNDNLTVAEYKQLLRKAKEKGFDQLYIVIKILAQTGIRISELKYFTYENLKKAKKEKNCIRVFNKGKEREIILPDKLSRELRNYCRQKKITAGYIILGKKNNEMPDNSTIFRQLKKLAGICRIKKSKVYPHNFRHFFSQMYLENGGDTTNLMKILGHSSLETTSIYTQQSVDQKRAILNRIKY